jgi:hypothetical protein
MRAWGFRFALIVALGAASFLFGWTWGFPDSIAHQIAASGGIAIALLLLVEIARRARGDWRAMRARERTEILAEVKRHES